MTKESKFDTAMGAIAGFAAIAETLLPPGVHWGVRLAIVGAAYLAGKLSQPGMPGKRLTKPSVSTPLGEDNEDPR